MAQGQVVFTVKKSPRGTWAVCETGLQVPLAEFDERDDAIEYARGIAATKPRASVDADGDGGEPGLRESYALDPVSGKSSRLNA
jgi:hypothetical protein